MGFSGESAFMIIPIFEVLHRLNSPYQANKFQFRQDHRITEKYDQIGKYKTPTEPPRAVISRQV